MSSRFLLSASIFLLLAVPLFADEAVGSWKILFDSGCPPCAAAASPEG